MTYLVYGLIDPRTGELRYVGKSCSGLARPRRHSSPYHFEHYGRLPVTKWAKTLVDQGTKPEIEVLESFADADSLAVAEIFWIAYFRGIGCRLLNLTDGGDGTAGHAFSPDHRRRLSEAVRRRYQDPKERQKHSQPGREVSDKTRRKIASSNGGRPFRDEAGNLWHTLPEAAAYWGVRANHICEALHRKRRKTVGGHVFTFVE